MTGAPALYPACSFSVCLKHHTQVLLMSLTGVGAQRTLPATSANPVAGQSTWKTHLSSPTWLSL